MNKNTGFTLTELVVVLTVTGILAAFGVPALTSRLPEYRLKKAAGELHNNLNLARMYAVSYGARGKLVFDTGAGQYSFSTSPGPDGFFNTGDDIKKTVTLSEYGSGVCFGTGSATKSSTKKGGALPGDAVSYKGNAVIFNPRGAVNILGYVYLTNNQAGCYAVGTPTLAGIVQLKKWYKSSSNWITQ